jgi:hypothetical protein
MRRPSWTPSIAPRGYDQDVYMVEDDLGRHGRIWPETDSETTDFKTVVADLLTGQYSKPLRVVAFNVAEGWSHDASADVAQELRRRCDEQFRDIPLGLKNFIDLYDSPFHDVQLPLPMRLY